MKLNSNTQYAVGGAIAGIVGLMIYNKMSNGSTGTNGNLLGARDFMHMPGNFAGLGQGASEGNVVGPLQTDGLGNAREMIQMPVELVQKMTGAVKKKLQTHDLLGQHWNLLGE